VNDCITSAQLDLCLRIRVHCQYQHWFGPSAEKVPNRYWTENDALYGCSDGSYRDDASGHRQVQGTCGGYDLCAGFAFPPATPAQIWVTEDVLGVPLPPMLRALYTTVANGGFGPAYGIIGIAGGYTFGANGRCQTLDQMCKEDPALNYVDLSSYLQERGNPPWIEWDSMPRSWFRHFWPICYIGCGEDYYLDAKSGRIYANSVGWNEQGDSARIIEYEAASLEEWLERWLQHDR
jgi:hypothetical protein